MPSGPFRKLASGYEPGMEAVDALSEHCVTSRTATAIRYAELTDAAVAVIVSTGGIIDYCFMSDALRSLPKLDWLRKGSPLPQGTASARLAALPEAVLAGERVTDEIDVRDWLGGPMKANVSEEAVGLGRYGKMLTVLASGTIGQEEFLGDDEESEEDLIERWTPRFRR